MAGVALAVLLVLVGAATAYDAHIVRASAPPGINPHSFITVPLADLFLFVVFFTGAIYYRKQPAKHKTLMLLTTLNFLPAAVSRLPVPIPKQLLILWTFGVPDLLAIICLAWFTVKHRKLNKIFAAGVLLLAVSHPLRVAVGLSETWVSFVDRIVS